MIVILSSWVLKLEEIVNNIDSTEDPLLLSPVNCSQQKSLWLGYCKITQYIPLHGFIFKGRTMILMTIMLQVSNLPVAKTQ